MNKYIVLLVALVNMVFLLQIACSEYPQQPIGKAQPIQNTQTEPSEFSLKNLRVSPAIANVGEKIEVSAKVTNTGGEGNYKAVLTLDNIEKDNKNVFVNPNSTIDIIFYLTAEKMSKYQVGIGEARASLLVSDCKQQNSYTISYDSGPAASWSKDFYATGSIGQITRFTPPALPFTVQKILLYSSVDVDNDEELDQHIATINIWDIKKKNIWSNDYSWRTFKGDFTWKEIIVPDVVFIDDFNVEFVSHSEEVQPRKTGTGKGTARFTCVKLGSEKLKEMSPLNIPVTRSGYSVNGKLKEMDAMHSGLNWMMRVEGMGCLLENKSE
jgi:hypothetical protein